ncbi:MAG: hypothetical protein OXH92_07210 [Bryobacterales bacterium]|nr:hypothetical protein [Bryobacterales bacterium]
MPESEDRGVGAGRGEAANDNPGSGTGAGGGPEARIGTAVMTLARLLGRQIAREKFRRLEAANDNTPAKDAGERRKS